MGWCRYSVVVSFIGLVASLFFPAAVNAEGFTYEFEGPVRLQQALANASDQSTLMSIHWPSARLIQLNKQQQVEQCKRELLANLDELRSYLMSRRESDKAQSVQNLYGQISRWQLGFQPVNTVSLELARQDIDYNPLLPEGRYKLVLSDRPDTASFYGLLKSPGVYPLVPSATAAEWLDELEDTGGISNGANRELAYVVREGKPQEVHWSYFKQSDVEVVPGDKVYLGFEPNALPPKFKSINDDVLSLMKHIVHDNSLKQSLNIKNERPEDIAATPLNHWSRLDLSPSYSNYGSVGLMQNPTARMAKEGELAVSYSDMQEYYRYTVNLQLLPWLETTAFYTRIPNRLYSNNPDFSGDSIYTDKGFDVKARLWKESYWLPELSVGLKDVAGTGLFDAEYIVGSKRFGPIDVSLGLGWGRLGTYGDYSNPLCDISKDYCDRTDSSTGQGGEFKPEDWFTGRAALFGGIEYQTPWEPLTLKAEYEGNDYSRDNAGVVIKPDSRWNFGVNYKLTDWFDIQLGYERGDTLTLNFSLRTNFNELSQIKITEDKVQPQPNNVSDVASVDWKKVGERLYKQGAFSGTRFAGNNEEVTVYGYSYRFRDIDEAYDRTARVLADELPPSVKEYHLVDLAIFDPNVDATVNSVDFKRRIAHLELDKKPSETEDLFKRQQAKLMPEEGSDQWLYNPERNFSTSYGLKPFLTQDYGNPENFITYQLGAYAFARRWFTSNLELFGEVGINIANNYDDFNFLSGWSDLPQVRTHARQYITNDVWLDSAQATYHQRLDDNWFAVAYAGYLERMFGGIGGEVMYREIDSPWAFGLNVNRVRQRNFTGGTGFRDYEVTTGFASVYYQMPWLSNSHVRLDVGQFLAGDKGVNVTFEKKFDSGVIAGAYAAFTDVSAEQYGEGSFTKGFYISIPFDLMSVRHTRERVGFSWMPLTRDGGQMLNRRVQLYGYTDLRSPYFNE